MNRRNFSKTFSSALFISAFSVNKNANINFATDSDIIKPQRLLPGDKVGLITPEVMFPMPVTKKQ